VSVLAEVEIGARKERGVSVRVAIVSSGMTGDGSMHRVRIYHVGTRRPEELTMAVLSGCPTLASVLASTPEEARREAKRTCREQKWTVIE